MDIIENTEDTVDIMDTLSPREKIMAQGLKAGKKWRDILYDAGYSLGSANVLSDLKAKMEGKISKYIPPKKPAGAPIEAMSKDEMVSELRWIALQSNSERNRMTAMAQISKLLGYDAPVRVDQNSCTALMMHIQIDDRTSTPAVKLPEWIETKELTNGSPD